MGQMRTELSRLKNQTEADDSAMETLTALLGQATQLHQIPATRRTLEPPDISILYAIDCGKMRLERQPYRGLRRDCKTVTSIACRALVSAVQTHLTRRSPLNEEISRS